MNFIIPVDHRVKIKKKWKGRQILGHSRELRTLWNVTVTVVPIIVGALGMVSKSLEKGQEEREISGRIKTILTTAFLRSARILRRVLGTWGNLLSFRLQWDFIGVWMTSCLTKAEEPSLSNYLPIAGGRIIGFIPFPRVLVLCEMQLAWSRIWTRVGVSISYDDNHYTTGKYIDGEKNIKVLSNFILFFILNTLDYFILFQILI